jgi:hypothetical protein
LGDGRADIDYMSGATNDLPNAIDNMVQQAQNGTARVEVSSIASSYPPTGTTLTVWVKVMNLAGHRFPTGVGFRRAFIELVVKDASGKVVWGSGRTNELGVIVVGQQFLVDLHLFFGSDRMLLVVMLLVLLLAARIRSKNSVGRRLRSPSPQAISPPAFCAALMS